MDLKFGHALFAAGGFLILVGFAALAAGLLSSVPDAGALEAFARGLDTIFVALFSGVMIGIGIALLGNGLVLRTLGNSKHVLLSALSSMLFLALATVAVFSRGGSQLFAIVSFFACLSASGAFLFTALWYALSGAARKYLLPK